MNDSQNSQETGEGDNSQTTPSEQETQTQTPQDSQKNTNENLKNRVSEIEKKSDTDRETRLKEIEGKVDQKIKKLESIVEEAESKGVTTSQPKKTEEDKISEKVEEELNSFEG